MSRFKIGQKIFTVAFTSEKNNSHLHSSSLPHRFGYEGDTKIHSKVLEVIEEIPVRWRYDEPNAEPKHRGYILRDEAGEYWSNQYPVADYGQTTTDGDYIFQYSERNFQDSDKEKAWKDYLDLAEEKATPVSYVTAEKAYSAMKKGVEVLLDEKTKEALSEYLIWMESEADRIGFVFVERAFLKDIPDIKFWKCEEKQ